MTDVPPRFEDEYPKQAAFMMRMLSAGAKLVRIQKLRFIGGPAMVAMFPHRLPRNEPCPCGSGIKTKKYHEQWT